jgi:hypothetical protein
VPPNSLVFLRVYLFRGGLCVGGNWPGIDSRIVGWGRERQRSQAFALLQNPVDEINIANVGRFDHFQNGADFFCSIRWHRFLRDCDGAF